MKGKLISFEGIDKVGKSTQAKRLAHWLRQHHRLSVVETREPGGTDMGEQLRRLILTMKEADAITEVLLMFAARREHLCQIIEPALIAGQWVVCDRFTDSTIAYQGGGRGIDLDFINTLKQQVQGVLEPDLTFYLKKSTLGKRATLSSDDVFESEGDAFFQRVAIAYQRIADDHQHRVVVIDGEENGQQRSIEAVAAAIQYQIERRFFTGRAAGQPRQ